MRGVGRVILWVAVIVLAGIPAWASVDDFKAGDRAVVIKEGVDPAEPPGVARFPLGTVLVIREVRGKILEVEAALLDVESALLGLPRTRAMGFGRVWSDRVAAPKNAVPALEQAVGDRAREPGTRLRAAAALSEIGKPAMRAVTTLTRVVIDDEESLPVKEAISECLVHLGPVAVPEWIARLKDRTSSLNARMVALFVLAQTEGRAGDIVAPFLQVLTELGDSTFLRDAAASELERLGNTAVPALSDLLSDEKQVVENRIAAARMLALRPDRHDALCTYAQKKHGLAAAAAHHHALYRFVVGQPFARAGEDRECDRGRFCREPRSSRSRVRGRQLFHRADEALDPAVLAKIFATRAKV